MRPPTTEIMPALRPCYSFIICGVS